MLNVETCPHGPSVLVKLPSQTVEISAKEWLPWLISTPPCVCGCFRDTVFKFMSSEWILLWTSLDPRLLGSSFFLLAQLLILNCKADVERGTPVGPEMLAVSHALWILLGLIPFDPHHPYQRCHLFRINQVALESGSTGSTGSRPT